MVNFSLLKGSHAKGSMVELLCMKRLWVEFLNSRKWGCIVHTRTPMQEHVYKHCMCVHIQNWSCREPAYLGLTFFNNIFYLILAHIQNIRVVEIYLFGFDHLSYYSWGGSPRYLQSKRTFLNVTMFMKVPSQPYLANFVWTYLKAFILISHLDFIIHFILSTCRLWII